MAESSDVDELEAFIRDEIAQQGTISVARFMEIALYHPGAGYYRRARDPFGKAGDFYTAEQLQPVFGNLISSYAEKLAGSIEDKQTFSILELGAGRGELRNAIPGWNYQGFDWSGDPLPSTMSGLVLSNEFFDALPVHLLLKQEGTWKVAGVCLRENKLSLTVMNAEASSELVDYARCFGSLIPEGGRLEVSLHSAEWFRKLSQIQRAGSLLVIDYGYAAHELARLAAGTLMTYRRHKASADFLSQPGQRDITAHVNFSYLKDLALHHGYDIEFDGLLNAWIGRIWNEEQLAARWKDQDQRWILQWKQLFFGMGQTFRVLELRKRSQKEKAPGC